MGWSVKADKAFFVGQRSLQILKARGSRQVLVGFELSQTQAPVSECHLIIADGEIAGRITSIGRSATLGKTIGLAMVKPTLSAAGTTLQIRGEDGASYAATVVSTPFYDPANSRQKDQAS
jgi:sarcosine oxidase subunit alpha